MSDDYEYEEITTTQGPTTTPFWTSEDNYDVAEVMTKRVTFTLYTWLFRLMIALALMVVVTFVICVPIALTLLILNGNIRRVVARKRKYWENEENLVEEVRRRVEEKYEELERKKRQREYGWMKEAVEDHNMLNMLKGITMQKMARGRGRGRKGRGGGKPRRRR